MAGVAESWWDKQAPDDMPPIRSCTIITTSAGPDMDGIHDRMPVILSPDAFDPVARSRKKKTSANSSALLRPTPSGTIADHPVGPRIGSFRNDDPQLIEPIGRPHRRVIYLLGVTGSIADLPGRRAGPGVAACWPPWGRARSGAPPSGRRHRSSPPAPTSGPSSTSSSSCRRTGRSTTTTAPTRACAASTTTRPIPGASAQAWPGGAAEHLLPFHLDTTTGIGECTYDLTHDWPAQHMSRGAGNDGPTSSRPTPQPQYEGPQHGV